MGINLLQSWPIFPNKLAELKLVEKVFLMEPVKVSLCRSEWLPRTSVFAFFLQLGNAETDSFIDGLPQCRDTFVGVSLLLFQV